ncbi:hypothetical protein FE773_08115 [Caminibacter mediatlanticus TB-2]|uniref:Periplasmic protein n=1 Tax=Caminibacter mediatlanticus TB-2 TaxID=391592 RepID=A0ABX5VE28_9BACT|nr:hypothetical protein [Caminibacter mediatlanticus]QCT95156.1 hypothetical protein FE773_08115 [Caminibacter mediatlanticus TB-2]
MKKIFILLFYFISLFGTENIVIYENNNTLENVPNLKEENINFDDNFVSLNPNVNICVIINKQKFYKFLPSIINSLNSYLLYKNIDYNISVYDINTSLESIKEKCSNIFVYTLNKDYIYSLSEYNNTNFYIPIFNKEDLNISSKNIYFGGIDYKQQINKLSDYIDDNKAIAINDNTTLSNKLFEYETNLGIEIIPFDYPKINYLFLNNKFIFFNTAAGKTAQILSQITAKEIDTKLQLSSQINYDPLLISITQPEDIKKLLIANSILNYPVSLEDINLLLNSDIKYNWLNFSSSILLNKVYNLQTGGDEFFINDFQTYIFDNQIQYKTNLYQIIDSGFKKIDN